ncbi:MAG TPA: tetratricopeptide repeat protein [Pyrinomonadaceae bacterium]|nr:tetratricopeptide repeat protein [Pyrinomonadaceae bacterium]
MPEVNASLVKRLLPIATCFALLLAGSALRAAAQDDPFGDSAADPIRMFERGQSAHARGELEKAIGFYEQALKVKPEFPEAEFQRGNALASLGRLAEAEAAFRLAISQKKNWSLPHSALGALLMRQKRDPDAEQSFRAALKIDANDSVALRMLSEIRLRAGDKKEAVDFARRATTLPDAPASAWIVLAVAERANGNAVVAKGTLDRVLAEDPANVAALMERADLLTDAKDFDAAIIDLRAAEKIKPGEKSILSRLAYVLQQAGRNEQAAEVASAAGLEVQQTGGDGKGGVAGKPEEIEAANSDDPAVARKALEKLLEKNPRNATLLGRLGASYRTDDPARSLEFYRRAAEIQPDSAEYAIGYAAALVQTRRFADAARILKLVVQHNPQNYPARANLATALYEAKRYNEAIPEYQWILATKPEIAVAHYFIATSHDYLGEYPEALASYEKFLAAADAKTNQLEIDKVKLRLPSLRRQIQLGEGAKKKPR